MKKIKKMMAAALAGVMALSLMGCGGAASSGNNTSSGNAVTSNAAAENTSSGDKQVIELTIGSGHSARTLDYMESLDDYFKVQVAERVAAETNYEIKWTDAYGTVVTGSETLDGTRDGLVDICAIFIGACAGELPLHNYTYILPFSCEDTKMCLDVTRQLYQDYSADLVDCFENNFNQKLLGVLIQPGYEIFSNSPIEKAQDLSGLKIGASGRNMLWLEGTGAVAVQANMTDAYTSLQTSLIDGTIQAPYWGVKGNFQDLVKYMTNIGLGCNSGVLLTVNLTKWNSLPAEVQTIIQEVATDYEEYQAQYAADTTEQAYKQCEEAGIQITTMTDEEKANWVNMLPNLPDTASELGSKGVEILEHYVELLEKAGYSQPRQWEFNY